MAQKEPAFLVLSDGQNCQYEESMGFLTPALAPKLTGAPIALDLADL